jgi:hypothetical protein
MTIISKVLDALEITKRDNTEWRFSPSILSCGWEFSLLSWCDFVLGREEETKANFISELRPAMGYIYERCFAEANPTYHYQQDLTYELKGFPLKGTCDFWKENDGFLEVVDTKCVASSVAQLIKKGNYPAYAEQLMLYAFMLSEETSRPVGKLTLQVLDRNYLNETSVDVEYNFDVVKQHLKNFVSLNKATQDVTYFSKLFDAITTTHAWSKYKPHGNCFSISKEGIFPNVDNLNQLKDDVICKVFQ